MTCTRSGDPWDSWWLREVDADPDYAGVVAPLTLELLQPRPGGTYLDAGCGEGRMMRMIESRVVGVDLSADLLRIAREAGPVVRYRLPSLACFADGSFDGCLVSLVLEHLSDHVTFFTELARVTRPGGVLALVANHPVFTAPDSGPIEEADGETTWRPGRYLRPGHTDEPVGEGQVVRFHHRPLGDLLTVASMAGWDLRRMVELGPSESQIRRHPPLAAQRHFVRLLGVRWTRRPVEA